MDKLSNSPRPQILLVTLISLGVGIPFHIFLWLATISLLLLLFSFRSSPPNFSSLPSSAISNPWLENPPLDFDFITPQIALGGALTDKSSVDALRTAGITHILSLTHGTSDAHLLPSQLGYLHNGTPDTGTTQPTHWFARSLDFALPALANPAHKLYCHCHAGISRSPATVYAILRALGHSPNAAEQLLAQGRPIAKQAYRESAEYALSELGYVTAPALR